MHGYGADIGADLRERTEKLLNILKRMNTFPTIIQIALTKCNICVNAAVFQSFAV